MTKKFIAAFALMLVASPGFTQTASQTSDPLAGLVERDKIDSSVPGRPVILMNQQIGMGVGAAKENAFARRGPYSWGDCPANTILTTLGTCARLER